MSKLKFGLLYKVLVAIVLGIVCSLFFPRWAVRIFVTFNSLFSNFLGMFVPLLIIGFIAPAIARIGSGAARLVAWTVGLAYLSTALVGFISYFTARWSFPSLLHGQMGSLEGLAVAQGIDPYFVISMPPPLNVNTALIIAFILGLGATAIKGKTFGECLSDFGDIVSKTIEKVIVPCLPLFIFGIFLKIGAEKQTAAVLGVFLKVVAVIVALHLLLIICQYMVAWLVSGRNPLKAIVRMLPAYLTALGTSSSAATIPVTLECTKRLGVRDELAELTVPLCATVHMPNSIMVLVLCCMSVSMCLGQPFGLDIYAGFILMVGVAAVAAPGVPGGVVMAALGLIGSMLGLDADMQGIIAAIFIAINSVATAGNVVGDGALSLIVGRISGDPRSRGFGYLQND